MSKSKNKKGFSLFNIILCGFAIVLCLGLLSNLSSGGGLPSGNTSFTTVPVETLAPGTRLPLTVELSGVQLLGSDGAAVETPEYVEVGTPLALTFSALPGYEYASGMGGLRWENAWPALQNNGDGTFTLTLDDFKGEVYVSITAVPNEAYPITFDLANCDSHQQRPTTVIAGSTVVLDFVADDGYSLPDVISVTGAEYSWRENFPGELVLSNFTGPVTVTIEATPKAEPSETFSFTLSFSVGQITLLSERPTAVSPEDVVYLEFTKTVSNAVFGYITPTNCEYEILSSSGDTLHIKVFGFTGDARVIVGSRLQYDIAYNLVDCSADPNNPDVAYSTGSVVLDFGANVGFSLPDEVTVVNAVYEWLPAVGTLRLYSVTGNVEIYITATEGVPDVPPVNSYFISASQNIKLTIPASDNPSVIQEGQSVVLTYTKANEYVVFGYVTVTGADYSTEIDGDTLTITVSNPTDNVVVIVGNEVVYPIEYSLTGCEFAAGHPTSAANGIGYSVQFYVMDDGYVFPEEISVINADYLWYPITGELYFDKVSGPVTIEIVAVPDDSSDPGSGAISYPVTYNFDENCYTLMDNSPLSVEPGKSYVAQFKVNDPTACFYSLFTSDNTSFELDYDSDFVKVYFSDVTGPVTVGFTHFHPVSISYNLENCDYLYGVSLQYRHDHIIDDSIFFSADSGYVLPDEITVTGAYDYEWDPNTGVLYIKFNSTDPILVEIIAVPAGQ